MRTVKKTAVLFLLCLMAIVAASCGKKELTFQDYVDLGEKYLMEEKYGEAIVAYTSAVNLEPEHAELYEKRGQAYEGQGDYGNAVTDYRKAIELDQENAAYYGVLADLYQLMGDLESMAEILRQGIEAVGDTGLLKRLDDYEKEDPSASTGQSLSEDVQKLLARLKELCESADAEGVLELLGSEELQAIIRELGEEPFIVISEGDDGKKTGTGVGLYRDEFSDWTGIGVYFGEYAEGSRLGHGMWYYFEEGFTDVFEGEWAGDKPNGASSLNRTDEDGFITVYSGNTSQGLWDGDINMEEIFEGESFSFTVHYDGGMAAAIGEGPDGTVVVSRDEEGDVCWPAEALDSGGVRPWGQ